MSSLLIPFVPAFIKTYHLSFDLFFVVIQIISIIGILFLRETVNIPPLEIIPEL